MPMHMLNILLRKYLRKYNIPIGYSLYRTTTWDVAMLDT